MTYDRLSRSVAPSRASWPAKVKDLYCFACGDSSPDLRVNAYAMLTRIATGQTDDALAVRKAARRAAEELRTTDSWVTGVPLALLRRKRTYDANFARLRKRSPLAGGFRPWLTLLFG